jgi:hypothetical protein
VFYEYEVDIYLNPKIGAEWGLKGQLRKVATPGQNKKHYLAGALHSQTLQISYIGGQRKKVTCLSSCWRRSKAIAGGRKA